MAQTMNGGSVHGADQRGLIAAAQATVPGQINRLAFDGRFNRMFPDLPAAGCSVQDLDSLAKDLSPRSAGGPETPESQVDDEENVGTAGDPGIPAGYTYFGQFVDHDITLDAVSLSMKLEDISAVENFRTPALDLDSVYARGPEDQPYLYHPGGRLLRLSSRVLTGEGGAEMGHDLLRIEGRAVIGDKRNDENVIISQLQGLFIRFHNELALGKFANSSFDEVRREVLWTYQTLVLWDYLPRIVGRDLVNDILPPGSYQPKLKFFQPQNTAFIPVEFAGAAYRFGHSMVRPIYRLNLSGDIGGPEGDTGRRMVFTFEGNGLNGFHEFNAGLGINWTLFFETGDRTLFSTRDTGPGRIQPAYKIDTSLVSPLSKLPEFSTPQGDPMEIDGDAAINVLAQRNLRRGMMLALPSGQAVARAMKLPVIPDNELIIAKAQAATFDEPAGQPLRRLADGRPTMKDNAPLWAYVLAEARHEWRKRVVAALALPEHKCKKGAERDAIINAVPTRLGPVGGRIVAETLIGLIAKDPRSVLNEGRSRGFAPQPGDPTKPGFERLTMGDLVEFVQARMAS